MEGSKFNLPFCLHLPDGEYDIKLPDGRVVRLKFETIIPKRHDERIGYRGLTDDDLTNVSKVVIQSQEFVSKDEIRNKTVDVKDRSNVDEFCRVSHFIDKNGRIVDPGLKDR